MTAAVWLASCASLEVVEDAPLPLRDESGAPVIATLHTRDGELTVTSTESGLRYSLLEADGQTRASLTLEELRAYNPHLYDIVKSATARSHPASAPAAGEQERLGDAPYLDGSVFGVPSPAGRASPPSPSSPILQADRHGPSPRLR